MISDAIGVVTVAMAMIENRHSGLIETTTFEYLSPRTQLGSKYMLHSTIILHASSHGFKHTPSLRTWYLRKKELYELCLLHSAGR